MSSYLGVGLASLDRWEGLKEWHRRHQDILGERSTSSSLEGCSDQFQSSLVDISTENRGLLFKNVSQVLETPDVISPLSEKHDLSIIPEADEDSRSRDGDLDAIRSKHGLPRNWVVPPMTDPSSRIEKDSKLAAAARQGNVGNPNSLQSSTHQQNPSNKEKLVKRPFLQRGQGLVKYNLKPEDVKRPYRKNPRGAATLKEDRPKPSSFAMKRPALNSAKVQPSERHERNPTKVSKTSDLEIPMQRLVLSIPTQKPHNVEIGTWSQVFGADTKPATVSLTENSSLSHSSQAQQFSRQDVPKAKTITSGSAFEPESRRIGNVLSPLRKRNTGSKTNSSPEEDQESLAAYLDLEQHVGNASFCSTSSKVDRLVTKSSTPPIHQSNPDAITQSKQLSPFKTGRKFLTQCRDNNLISEDNVGVWSATDIENLLKARARRSGSLIKPYTEPNKTEVEVIGSGIGKTLPAAEHPSSRKSVEAQIKTSQNQHFQAAQEAQNIDLMLEALGPARKPHLMKTMSSIDLDSSLIKKALAPTPSQESEFESESESSSSDSSSEEELDADFTGVNGSSNMMPPDKPVEESPNSKDVNTVSRVPLKLVSDATLDEINHQIESHLSDLRKEIETLQQDKGKTQKYISNLEKKVQELEHRLILDARSFNRRLEDEREAAAKRLLEEQGKLSKEKQALQRSLREERRKAPDPVTQQEFLRLKQEVAQWEEKWRADRAKARGLESNLRIQLSNLKRENEKLKEENSKIRREKETALNTAKAKASSNTRVINSIAQQLGTNKPKVTIVREENPKRKKQMVGSAYNLKTAPQVKATIENFPKPPYTCNEWSSDEEIDLGKETSDEDDMNCNEDIEIPNSKLQPPVTSASVLRTDGNESQKLPTLQQESIDMEEAQAKYDAIFGKGGNDSVLTPTAAEKAYGIENAISSKGNQSPAPNTSENDKFVKSIHHSDGKVEQVKENGTRVITYPDGTWRRHSSSGSVMTVPPSGWPVQISYFNGDQLEKLSDGSTRYFYAKTNVWQITHPDGHEEMRYPSGKVERREPDGSVRVLLPGSTSKTYDTLPGSTSNTYDTVPNSEVDSPPDGVSVEKLPNGDTVFRLPNGECELHTKNYMKKDYLDGTVKFLYKDGSQETRYPSGRIRIKDAQGNLVKDTSLA